MTINVSIRKSLRKIPAFRLLSKQELDTIFACLICKKYKSGDVLWRTGTRLDFLGIIQSGEIVVERRIKGLEIRSVRLLAGDIVQPSSSSSKIQRSSFLARAETDVSLWVLHEEQLAVAQSKLATIENTALHRMHRVNWRILWSTFVVILTILLSWRDISRVASGALYFMAKQENRPTYNYQKSVQTLNYAEAIDPSATFAYNQEGYIWFQNNDLKRAEQAFIRASEIDETNGASLNNLAVTYFTTGRTQRSIPIQKNAVQNNPDNAIARYNLSIVLKRGNFYEEAVRELKQASYIDPNWALPYLEQGFIYLQMQDYINAEQSARSAIQIDSNQQGAYSILGIALFNQDRDQEALETMHHVLQFAPDDRVALFYKALILSNLNEFDSALGILQELLESSNNPQQVPRIADEIEHIMRSMKNPSTGIVIGGE